MIRPLRLMALPFVAMLLAATHALAFDHAADAVRAAQTTGNLSPGQPADTILGSPANVPFQGFLTDAGGIPLGVPSPISVPVEFRFYDDATAGTLLHSETHNVTVSEGVFQQALSPPANLFHGLPRFLGLAVDGGAELTPRTEILSTPFALVSHTLSGYPDVVAELQEGGGLTEIVAGTTDQMMRRYYLAVGAGFDWAARRARVIIAANGQSVGGSGVVTVSRNGVPVAVLPISAGGNRAWTYAVDLPVVANSDNIDVEARADAAAAPLLVRSITLDTDVDTGLVSDGDWTVVGTNMESAVAGRVGIGVAAGVAAAKLDVSGGTEPGLQVTNTGTMSNFALFARNHSLTGTTAAFASPSYGGGGYPGTPTALAAWADGTDNATNITSFDGDGVWARVDGTGSAVRGWDYGGVGLAGEFIGNVSVTGNVQAAGANGDFYTTAGDGVINCGGGLMNAFANVIADATPTLQFATGDEDLYIGDDLEVAGQGYKPGGGSWATLSDARLKKDIRDFEDGLDAVLRVRPVWYRYNDRSAFAGEREYVGVVAQEMRDVAPYTVEEQPVGRVVREDETGKETVVDPGEDFLVYDSSALVYLLVNAVQEQQTMIEQQRTRIEELERRIGAR